MLFYTNKIMMKGQSQENKGPADHKHLTDILYLYIKCIQLYSHSKPKHLLSLHSLFLI